MCDDFAALSGCQRIWGTLERRAINREAERSAANEAITREPVSFSLSCCDLTQWEQEVPRLPNRAGGDLYGTDDVIHLVRVWMYCVPLRDFQRLEACNLVCDH